MADVKFSAYPAPSVLVEHCTRRKIAPATATTGSNLGTRDRGDVAGLIKWLVERDEFSTHDAWVNLGMSLRLEYGADGLELWQLAHDDTVSNDVELAKWNSFSEEPSAESVTLNSVLARAHKLGWKGTVRKSTSSMFDGVAQIAAAAGASLHSGLPTPGLTPGMPMMAGQAELARLGAPILQTFLASISDTPTTPISDDIPTLPPSMSDHGLYTELNESISRIIAMAEPTQPKWRSGRVTAPLVVLMVTHADVYEAVRRRIEAMGRPLQDAKIKLGAKSLEDQVQRAFVRQDDWIYDARSGLPESDNPDNVTVFLAIVGAELRWNTWMHRAEIQGFEWPAWQAIDDVVIAKLKVRALRTGTRFRVANEFLKETLLAISHLNPHDPVVERINSIVWDGTPRLAIWLSATCGVPCDLYHQTVGKNVIGGMVKRARRPGSKHDEVMILMGIQGTAKSELCRTLALDANWFTDSVTFDGSPQNIVPQLFGKLVVELAELDGMAKKEVQSIKRFISTQSDNVTLKYKAYSSEHARRCIFIGTSNEDAPLVDITGNRRFLPVRTKGEVNITWLRANIEQLFAEAAVLHTAGADFSIPRDVWSVAATHQEAARSVSDIETLLTGWFAEGPHTTAAFVSVHDLAELCEMAGWKRMETMRNAIMRKLGFRDVNPYINRDRVRGWLRAPADMPLSDVAKVVRYQVGKSSDGRPRVTIRMVAEGAAVAMPTIPGPRA